MRRNRSANASFSTGPLGRRSKSRVALDADGMPLTNAERRVAAEKARWTTDATCWHRFRRAVRGAVQHRWFDSAIMAVIMVNCVTLAVEDPLKPTPKSIAVLDVVFLVIFTIELLLKWIGLGICRFRRRDFGIVLTEEAQQAADAEEARRQKRASSHALRQQARAAALAHERAGPPTGSAQVAASPGSVTSDTEQGLSAQASFLSDRSGAGSPLGVSHSESIGPMAAIMVSTSSESDGEDEDERPRASAEAELAYFQSGWNLLDFIIVVMAYTGYIPGLEGGGSNAVRLLRVLRPLRAFNKLKSLKLIVDTLLTSLAPLSQVVVLIMFLWAIYGIVGLQLFNGVLHQHCFPEAEADLLENGSLPLVNVDDLDPDSFCSIDSIAGGRSCPAGTRCVAGATNPGFGLSSFDNIGAALLNIYIVTTMANWVDLMYPMQDAWGGIVWLYFVSLILFSTFFAMNLILAVVVDSYENNTAALQGDIAAAQREKEEKEELARLHEVRKRKRAAAAAASASLEDMSVQAIEEVPEEPDDDEAPAATGAGGGKADTACQASPRANALAPPPDQDKSQQELAKLRSVASERLAVDQAIGGTLDERKDMIASMFEDQAQASKKERQQQRQGEDERDPEEWAAEKVAEADEELRRRNEWLVGKPRFFVWVHIVATHWLFTTLIVVAIVVNTIVLAMDHRGISQRATSNLELANFVLTLVFTLEMVIKLLGLGPRQYARDSFNLFDAFIVIMSLLELVIFPNGGSGGAVSVLRAFRLLRVLKLAKSIKSLRILLETVIQSIPDIFWMSMLLSLFVFMFAVLGRQLYAGRLQGLPEDIRPDFRFDSFISSILTVFQVITSDDWPIIMQYVSLTSSQGGAVAFFVSCQVLGELIILNLFVAVLLQRFADQTDEHFDEEDLLTLAVSVRSKQYGFPHNMGKVVEVLPRAPAVAQVAETIRELRHKREEDSERKRKRQQEANTLKCEGYSMGCLGPEMRFRKWLFNFVTHPYFEGTVIVLILANCVFLAIENPSISPKLEKVLFVSDIAFTSLFTLEMFMKVAAFGAWTPRYGYLANGWNVLDAFVVLVSVASLMVPGITALRALRALRPLRVVVRSSQIRVVIQALFYALPNIANVLGLTILFWLIFAILGVSLFKGTFGSCSDGETEWEVDCVNTYLLANGSQVAAALISPADSDNATLLERDWEVAEPNFDSVGNAFLALFQVATLSAWADVARQAMASTEEGRAPVTNHNQGVAFFFLAFLIIGSFFSLNLFIGVVIDNFNRLKKELDGSAFLTYEQVQYLKLRKIIQALTLETKPEPPDHRWREPFYRLALRPGFDMFIMACIILNTLVMMMQHYEQGDVWNRVLDGFNLAFFVIFACEAAIKITAFSFTVYLSESWNQFDFAVVLLSFGSFFVDAGVGASVVRLFRIFRVFRLIKRAKTLQRLLQTLYLSASSLFNIGSFLFVLFYIFAVLGVALFGDIPLVGVDDDGLTRYASYRNFGASLLTLWRCATGDAWEELMFATMAVEPMTGALYHVAMQVVLSFIMIQLFIAVILENFSDDSEGEDAKEKAEQQRQMKRWSALWNIYDPLARTYIPAACFPVLMLQSPRPFGFARPGQNSIRSLPLIEQMRHFRRMQIPVARVPRRLVSQHAYRHAAAGMARLARSEAKERRRAERRVRRKLGVPVPPSPASIERRSSAASLASHARAAEQQAGRSRRASAFSMRGVGGGAVIRKTTQGDLPRQAFLAHEPSRSVVWAVNFRKTLTAMARTTIGVDIRAEEMAKGTIYMHEFLAVRIIWTAWLRQREVARQLRQQGRTLRQASLEERVQAMEFASSIVGVGSDPEVEAKAGGEADRDANAPAEGAGTTASAAPVRSAAAAAAAAAMGEEEAPGIVRLGRPPATFRPASREGDGPRKMVLVTTKGAGAGDGSPQAEDPADAAGGGERGSS